MKRAWADSARADEVRKAARGWAHAGAIDASTLAAIEGAYPASRAELHRAWRVLVFVLACVALGAVFGGVFLSVRSFLWPVAGYAAVLTLATDALRGSRISGSGADAATSFVGFGFLIAAVALFLDEWKVDSPDVPTILLAASAAAGALAAWRWGFWFYAAVGAGAGYLLVGRMAWARPAWLILAALVMAGAWRWIDRASIAPPHRRSLAAMFAVSAAAAYAAVNLYSLDMRLVERIRLPWPRAGIQMIPAPAALRFAAALATAVFPLVFLAWGIRSRRRLPLGIGITASVLSVATLRHYVPIGPRWAYLTACGALLIGLALWAHRRLRDAANDSWRGLTASPLYSDADAGISPLGALGAHIAVPTAPEPERPGFTGGGGSFGGGGASGQY